MIRIDVEMPEKCSDCKFEYDPYGEYGIHWCYLQGVGGGETDAGRGAGRLPSCPLIDVPIFYVGNSSEIPNSSTDCISRQAAIGAICSACGKIDCYQMDTCEKLKLPSEQSEPCEDAVSDLIDRQEAIDALKVAYWDKDIQSSKDDPCIVDAMTDWAIRQVKALPSVQPEPCDDPRADVYYLAKKIGIHRLYELVVALRGEPELISDEQKNDGWIPIGERLPQEEGSYLVTDDAGGVKTVQDDEFLHYEDGTPLWLYSQNVTAWKPSPEPYLGDKDDFNNKRFDS